MRLEALEGLTVTGMAVGPPAGRIPWQDQVDRVVDEHPHRRNEDALGRRSGEVDGNLVKSGHRKVDDAASLDLDGAGKNVVIGRVAGLCGVHAGAEGNGDAGPAVAVVLCGRWADQGGGHQRGEPPVRVSAVPGRHERRYSDDFREKAVHSASFQATALAREHSAVRRMRVNMPSRPDRRPSVSLKVS